MSDLVKRAREAADYIAGGGDIVGYRNAALLRELADELQRVYDADRGRTNEHNILVRENRALSARLAAISKAAEPFVIALTLEKTGAVSFTDDDLLKFYVRDLRALARACSDEGQQGDRG